MGLCQGRQEVGRPRGGSVEGWHLSQLPPRSPQPPEAAVGLAEETGAREEGASLPRPILPQPTPVLFLVIYGSWVTVVPQVV